jgi:hypothetical protein
MDADHSMGPIAGSLKKIKLTHLTYFQQFEGFWFSDAAHFHDHLIRYLQCCICFRGYIFNNAVQSAEVKYRLMRYAD